MSFALITNNQFVKYNGITFDLTTDINEAAYFSIYDDPSVFNSELGAVAIYHEASGGYLRHFGYTVYANSFDAQNYDYAWVFNPDGTIYNYFGGGWYLGISGTFNTISTINLPIRSDGARLIWKWNGDNQGFDAFYLLNNQFAGYTDPQEYLSLVPVDATHIKLGNYFYSISDAKLVNGTNQPVTMGDMAGDAFDVGTLANGGVLEIVPNPDYTWTRYTLQPTLENQPQPPIISDVSTTVQTSDLYTFNGTMTFIGQNIQNVSNVNYNTLYTRFKSIITTSNSYIFSNLQRVNDSNTFQISNVNVTIDNGIEYELYVTGNVMRFGVYSDINPITSIEPLGIGSSLSIGEKFNGDVYTFNVYGSSRDYFDIKNLSDDAIWGPFDSNAFTFYSFKSQNYFSKLPPPSDTITSNVINFSNGFTVYIASNTVGTLVDMSTPDFIEFNSGKRIRIDSTNTFTSVQISSSGVPIFEDTVERKNNFYMRIEGDTSVVNGDVVGTMSELIQGTGSSGGLIACPSEPITTFVKSADSIDFTDPIIGQVTISSSDTITNFENILTLDEMSSLVTTNTGTDLGGFGDMDSTSPTGYNGGTPSLGYAGRTEKFFTPCSGVIPSTYDGELQTDVVNGVYGSHFTWKFPSARTWESVEFFINSGFVAIPVYSPRWVFFFASNDGITWTMFNTPQTYEYPFPFTSYNFNQIDTMRHVYPFEAYDDSYSYYRVVVASAGTGEFTLSSIRWNTSDVFETVSEQPIEFGTIYTNPLANVYMYNRLVTDLEIFNGVYRYSGNSVTRTATSHVDGDFVDLFLDRNIPMRNLAITMNQNGDDVSTSNLASFDGIIYEPVNFPTSNSYTNYRFVVKEIKPKFQIGYYVTTIPNGILTSVTGSIFSLTPNTEQVFTGLCTVSNLTIFTSNTVTANLVIGDNNIYKLYTRTTANYRSGDFNISGLASTINTSKIQTPKDVKLKYLTYDPKQVDPGFKSFSISKSTQYTPGMYYTSKSTGTIVNRGLFDNPIFGNGYAVASTLDGATSNIRISYTGLMSGSRTINLYSTDDVKILLDSVEVLNNKPNSLLNTPVDLYYTSNVVYFTDQLNRCVRKVDETGQVTTVSGIPGQIGTSDGGGKVAVYDSLSGIAYNPTLDIIYVVDSNACTIRSISGSFVTTLAGTPYSKLTVDGIGSEARFNSPTSLSIDSDGNLYVAESSGSVIRKVTPSGDVTTIAGDPTASGYSDGTGSSAKFNNPGFTHIEGDKLYIADTLNNCIRLLNVVSYDVTTFAGVRGEAFPYDGTSAEARFRYPVGITKSVDGNFYVTDSGRIRCIDQSGNVFTIADNLIDPQGIKSDSDGNLYVCEGHVILKVSNLQTSTFAGTPGIPGYQNKSTLYTYNVNENYVYPFEIQWSSNSQVVLSESFISLSNLGPYRVASANIGFGYSLNGSSIVTTSQFERQFVKPDYGLSKQVSFGTLLRLYGSSSGNVSANTNFSNVLLFQNSNEYIAKITDDETKAWSYLYANLTNTTSINYISITELTENLISSSQAQTMIDVPGNYVRTINQTSNSSLNFMFRDLNVTVTYSETSNIAPLILNTSNVRTPEISNSFTWSNSVVFGSYVDYTFSNLFTVSNANIGQAYTFVANYPWVSNVSNAQSSSIIQSDLIVNSTYTDSENNIYIAGTKNSNAHLFKYDQYGNLLWYVYLTEGTSNSLCVQVDSDKNVYFQVFVSNRGRLVDSSGTIGPFVSYTVCGAIFKLSSSGISQWNRGISYFGGLETYGKIRVVGSDFYMFTRFDFYLQIFDPVNFYSEVIVGPGSHSCLVKFNKDGYYQWHETITNSYANDISYHAPNIYLAGTKLAQESTTSFINGQTIPNTNGTSSFVFKINDRTLVWSSHLDGFGEDSVSGVTTDSSGNVYLVGTKDSQKLIIYKDILKTGTEIPVTIQHGVYIIKYSSNGTVLWNRTVDGIDNDEGQSITVNSFGNVFISGTTGQSGANIISNVTCNGAFYVQYTPTGSFVNFRDFPNGSNSSISMDAFDNPRFTYYESNSTISTVFPVMTRQSIQSTPWRAYANGASNTFVSSITTDSNNSVYIAGYNLAVGTGVVAIYNSNGSPSSSNLGNGNCNFVIKYNSNGAVEWRSFVSNARSTSYPGVSVDLRDNVYLTGSSNASSNVFDIRGLTTISTPAATSRGYCVKLLSNGVAQNIVGWENGDAYGVSSDSTLAYYICGSLRSAPNTIFNSNGSGSSINFPTGVADRGALVKYNESGVAQWRAYGNQTSRFSSVKTDSLDNVYICGWANSGTSIFGPASNLALSMTVANSPFCAKLNSNGAPLFRVYMNVNSPSTSPIYDGFLQVAVDSLNNFYTVGTKTLASTPIINSNGSNTHTFPSNSAIMCTKFDSTGNVIWRTHTTTTTENTYRGTGIHVDSLYNVYIAGSTGGTSHSIEYPISSYISSIGGTRFTYDTYVVHVFESSGAFTVDKNILCDILVVAGGGGGGVVGWGGGGAGGVIYKTNVPLGPGMYNVMVGLGGSPGNNGSNSSVLTITAVGGGSGGTYPNGNGKNGGSGGGGAADTGLGGLGITGQGNNGGSAVGSTGGGGGGAGTPGSPGTFIFDALGGNGGDGLEISITGTPTYYGGGGGGATNFGGLEYAGKGGLGGGGNGGDNFFGAGSTGTPGTDGTGGGGGGGSSGGSPGGSGIVIIRYTDTSDYNTFNTQTSNMLTIPRNRGFVVKLNSYGDTQSAKIVDTFDSNVENTVKTYINVNNEMIMSGTKFASTFVSNIMSTSQEFAFTIPAMNFSGPYVIKFDNLSTVKSTSKSILTIGSNIFSCGRVEDYSQMRDLTNTQGVLIRNGSYITKSDFVGNSQWVILFDGIFTSISTDGSNIYSVGTKGTNVSNIFSADGSKYTIPNTDSYSAVVSKFNSSGIHQWSKYSIYGENYGRDIEVNAGNVYAAVDRNLIKFDRDGQVLWNNPILSSKSVTIMNNNVYTANTSILYKHTVNGVPLSNIVFTNTSIISIVSDVSNIYMIGNLSNSTTFVTQVSENGNVNWINYITGNVIPTSINSNLYVSAIYSGTSNILFTNANVAFSLTSSNTSFVTQYTSTGRPIRVRGYTSNVVGVTGNLFTVFSSGTISKFTSDIRPETLSRWSNTSNTSNTWRIVLPANTNVNSIQFRTQIPTIVNVYTSYQTLQSGPLTYSNNFANFIEYSDYPIDEFQIIGNVGSNIQVFSNGSLTRTIRNSNINGLTLLSNHGSSGTKRIVFASVSNVQQLTPVKYGTSGTLSNLSYTGNVNIWTDGPHNYFYDQTLSNTVTITGFRQLDDPVTISTNKYALLYPFQVINNQQKSVEFSGNFELTIKSDDWANTQFYMDSISTTIGSVQGNVVNFTKTSNGVSPFAFTGNMLFANEITFTGYTANAPNLITNANITYTSQLADSDVNLSQFTMNIIRSNNSYAFDPNFKTFRDISNVSTSNTTIDVGYYSFANIHGYFSLPQTGVYTANIISGGSNVIFAGNLNVVSETAQYYTMKIYNELSANTYVDVILSNAASNAQYKLSDYTFTENERTRVPNLYKSNTAFANYKTI
jgi:hypothetical protein